MGDTDVTASLVAAEQGRLMAVLNAVPRARWFERSALGWTLLHNACHGDNVDAVAALLAHGVDANARSFSGSTAAHFAAMFARPRTLALLCSAGTDLRARDASERTPLDLALCNCPHAAGCVRVLLANGVRLHIAAGEYAHLITPEMRASERGVVRCRAAVVTMLRVKRIGRLVRWDRFLLVEMAICVWTTRLDPKWQEER